MTFKHVAAPIAGVAVAAALFLGVAACGNRTPFDPCTVNPTKTNAEGVWVEADDEPLDSDPCDSDDFTEDGKRKPVKPKVTPAKTGVVVVPTPAKPAPVNTRTTRRNT